jgi:LPS O-antigen subunit length determinant protein (WzzB/FepE family)
MVVAAAASSAEPNAVMLLSLSIANVVIIVLLGVTLCVVITWITPNCLRLKAILNKIDDGEVEAMEVRRLRQIAPNERSREQVRAEKRASHRRLAHAAQH